MKTIEQKVLKFIDQNNLIHKGEKLLVALSGGPDSVFVLHIMTKFKERWNITLGAAHVNHGLRGSSADEDEVFCKELSGRIGVQYFVAKIDVKSYAATEKISIEEAARVLRYKFLITVSKEHFFNKIITAHNLNDNAETVLLNLIKGTGLRGMAGIPVSRDNIIRPILSISKQEILEYLNSNNIKFRIDETNFENIYERNYIRNNVLPVVKEINPSIEYKLLNTSAIFRNLQVILDDYISFIYNKALQFSENKVVIELKILDEFKPEILGEIVKKAVSEYFKVEFEYDDYLKVKSLINKQPGRKVQLSGKLYVYKERESLIIQMDDNKSFFSAEISAGETIMLDDKELNIRFANVEDVVYDNNRFREFISADNVTDNKFIVRRWKFGDRFKPIGMKGYKKVSDFLTEQKILTSEKAGQLVLIHKDEIVWLPGLRIDDRYKITKSTQRIFELCLK